MILYTLIKVEHTSNELKLKEKRKMEMFVFLKAMSSININQSMKYEIASTSDSSVSEVRKPLSESSVSWNV